MKVRVELFAQARDTAGTSVVELELAGSAQIADLRRQLLEICPELKELLEQSRIAVNNRFAPDEHGLAPEDLVAVIPPVSGG